VGVKQVTRLILLLLFASPALAQQQPVVVAGATFSIPTEFWVGVVAVVTTMGTAIGKLYYDAGPGAVKAAEARVLAHEKEKAEMRAGHHAAMDALKAEHRKELTELHAKLETEKDERLKEQERLLREQKDLLREVMTTCAQITKAMQGDLSP
jgi:hypothetical protein